MKTISLIAKTVVELQQWWQQVFSCSYWGVMLLCTKEIKQKVFLICITYEDYVCFKIFIKRGGGVVAHWKAGSGRLQCKKGVEATEHCSEFILKQVWSSDPSMRSFYQVKTCGLGCAVLVSVFTSAESTVKEAYSHPFLTKLCTQNNDPAVCVFLFQATRHTENPANRSVGII